jgi:hypothetical protein
MRVNPGSASMYSSLQRPRVPPPPPPPHRIRTTPLTGSNNAADDQRNSLIISSHNGHSHESLDMDESLPSLGSDDMNDSSSFEHHRSSIPVPVPPPRKVSDFQNNAHRMKCSCPLLKRNIICISFRCITFHFAAACFCYNMLLHLLSC